MFFDPNNDVTLRYDKTLHKIFDINEDSVADKESPELINYLTCSGTMISSNLYLTAAHCINASLLYEDSFWGPYRYANPDLINKDQFPPFAYVFFDYQDKRDHHLRERVVYAVKSVVEVGDIYSDDYAILELYDIPLRNEPFYYYYNENILSRAGISHKFKRIEKKLLNIDDDIAVIGYPLSYPEVISTGKVTKSNYDEDYYFNHSAHIYSGNSGSGILNTDGNIAGICHAVMGKVNEKPSLDIKISYIVEQSDILSGRIDNDGDGIPFLDDKCPSIYDPNQEDWNNNGIGDACEDSDNDGVIDAVDNCPEKWNPFETMANPSSEIIKGLEAIGNGYWEHTNIGDKYIWQPDHDLDGIGDACDSSAGSQNEGGYSVSIAYKPKGSISLPVTGFGEINKTISISIAGGYYKNYFPVNNGDGKHRVHYCGADLQEYCPNGLWNSEKTGCTLTSYNNWDSVCETETLESGTKIGHTHATASNLIVNGRTRCPQIAWTDNSKDADNINYKNAENYKRPVTASQNISTIKPSAYWNWRADIYAQYNCGEDDYYKYYALCEENGEIRSKTPMYYTLSSNYATNDERYLINGSVNPEYFKNFLTRENINDYNSVGKWSLASRSNTEPAKIEYSNATLNLAEIMKQFREIVSQGLLDSSAQNILIPMESFISGNVSFTRYQHGGFININNSDLNLTTSSIDSLPLMQAVIEDMNSNATYTISETSDNVYELFANYAPSSDWQKIGTVTNYSDYLINSIKSAAVYDNTIYFIGSTMLRSVTQFLYKIVREEDDSYVLKKVLQQNLGMNSSVKLIPALGNIYIAADKDGVMEISEVDLAEGKISEIESDIKPFYSLPLNIIGTETGIYLTGRYNPENSKSTSVMKFDKTNGWQIINDNINADTEKLIMNNIDGRIVMTNILSTNDTTSRIELDTADNSIKIEEVETVDIFQLDTEEPHYCVSETGNSIYPGITERYGTCNSVTDYNYDSHLYFDYKLTVAGYKNNLYIGGLSGIRRIKIESDGTLKKKKLTTNGKTNNLAISENRMYAANYGEIDIFKIAEDGSIDKKSDINSDKCENIRIAKGMLFTAENKKVKIYDLSDPYNPSLISSITADGEVVDLEVVKDKLYIYREKTKWFSTKGYVEIYDISNIKSPQKRNSFNQKCNDAEMQSFGDTVYLGCKNGQFKASENGLTKMSGEKNYLREGYAYKGILYQVFSGKLHLSK